MKDLQLYVNIESTDVFAFKIMFGDEVIQEVAITPQLNLLDFSVFKDYIGEPIKICYFTDNGCKTMFVAETTLTAFSEKDGVQELYFLDDILPEFYDEDEETEKEDREDE